MIRGIFSSEEDFREKTKESTYGLLHYRSNENDRQFVIRSWNVFSTIYFVQECLKRFGEPGDKFVLRYCEKEGIGERVQQFSKMLTTSKNLILRGAPGTGKSYLAKQIAAYLVSGGTKGDCKDLSDTQKKQVEFVQFHPSYDYTDFVEGLRPKINEDGTMGFALQDGIFKKFVARARKSYEDHLKSKQKDPKKYIFIIDEINRGEISKIFGELFFAIDPGYRGNAGEISTQYANLHADPDEKFYIPDNMYIIGTMNDIDRSVDSFDFAMRRRFRFVEIKADDRLEMLASLEDDALEIEAIKRMTALNQEIARTEDLSESYQIGASYFLKLKELDFDQLWTDYLQPLLQEYIRGMYNEKEIMQRFEKAYEYQKPLSGDENDALQD
jgi:5-methylcytosine-specific restriction endonuclease McrBC GTP-binding regulatory subunit McrB